MFSVAWWALAPTLASAFGGHTKFVVPTIRDFIQAAEVSDTSDSFTTQAIEADLYPAYNLSVPVDHFHNDSLYEPHSDGYFNLRYWFDASHYQKGGPVIVFAAGEASGRARLPLLQKGIVAQLASAMNGIGVILEHRYYGTSYPVTVNTIEDFRFLTTDQALADTAYFANNIVFPGLESENVTASQAPWIAYGVSYSGGFVAFLRKLYPEVFWGAVASSAVTEAIDDFWQYYEPVKQYGPSDCIQLTQNLMAFVDEILIDSQNATLKKQLKTAFGAGSAQGDADFANMLSGGVQTWQSRNWDPQIGSLSFRRYCDNLTSPSELYHPSSSLQASVTQLLEATSYGNNETLKTSLLNWIGWLGFSDTSEDMASISDSNVSIAALPASSLSSWGYQVCTQWAYFETGTGVPSSAGLPLISKTITLEYASSFCNDSYGIPTRPNTTAINKYGGFDISYPRLAWIGGLADPWRPATPQSDAAPPRQSTESEPSIIIDVEAEDVYDGMQGAVHHWEANSVFGNETKGIEGPPPTVAAAQKEIVEFTDRWVQEWHSSRKRDFVHDGSQRLLP